MGSLSLAVKDGRGTNRLPGMASCRKPAFWRRTSREGEEWTSGRIAGRCRRGGVSETSQAVFELRVGNNVDTAKRMQHQKVFVAGYDQIGFGRYRKGKEKVVFRITARFHVLGYRDWLC